MMQKTKQEWISQFRKEAEHKMIVIQKQSGRKKKTSMINHAMKQYADQMIDKTKKNAKQQKWDKATLLSEILLITYASYIVMLEYRNKIWPYEYMAFARRIGELWEPFCKLTFEYSVKQVKLIDPPDFDLVQAGMKKEALDYISSLEISGEQREKLIDYYNIPWSLVDSGAIKLNLDLHFEQNGVHYNCDFKSGFSSNEKGNTNRLLLVGSIYQSLGGNEKTLLFVRQEENQNKHYLKTLKNSSCWNCYCADVCYAKMSEFTGFNLRTWLDTNVNWTSDISTELKKHLEENDLIGYLTW